MRSLLCVALMVVTIFGGSEGARKLLQATASGESPHHRISITDYTHLHFVLSESTPHRVYNHHKHVPIVLILLFFRDDLYAVLM